MIKMDYVHTLKKNQLYTMKKIFTLLFLLWTGLSVTAQDFNKNLSAARSSYSSGNLTDARFEMEQMLSDLDRIIGKEILKLLPTTLNGLNYNAKDDNVTGSSGNIAAGLYVHRSYGTDATKDANIEIINNSPLITSINAILSTPILGSMMRNENQSVVRVQGYKSLLNKNTNSETGKTSYQLQIPMNNTLLTINMDDTTEDKITNAANQLPLQKIVQIAQ
ncbi:MAG: hypothetical protein OJF59_002227 [Cytophagales bacterium]|jgi:hypothetical protein|nr:MAG: hypothetical protein OJF59_002227 [Cytophagales bacterium]